MNNWLWS